VKTREFDAKNGKPCVLITGGTHGYETSGVQGALLFASTVMEKSVSFVTFFSELFCVCFWLSRLTLGAPHSPWLLSNGP
jgi:hypothetical protein